jgi:hypothetical protein
MVGKMLTLALMTLPVAAVQGDDKPKAQKVIVEVVGAVEDPDPASGPLGVAVAGKYAYVCNHKDGLRIVDVSDPKKPQEIGSFHTIGRTRDVSVQGRFAFVANQEAGLRVVDVSDPSLPREVASCRTRGEANRVSVVGAYAYVAGTGLEIVDVSDPKAPKLISSFDKPQRAMGIALRGQHAYVADKSSALWVVDVSNPADPRFVSSWRFRDEDFGDTGEPQDVFLAGKYAYVADDDSALHIVDISDPKAPSRVSSVSERTGDFGEAVAVVGNYAYVACAGGRVSVFDVSLAERPLKVAAYDTRAGAYGLTVAGNCAYVNVGKGQLVILRTLSGDADIKRAIEEHIRSLLADRAYSKYAGEGLIRIGAPAVPYLIEMLKSSEPHRRAFAAILLRDIKPAPTDVNLLVEALIDTLKERGCSAGLYAAGALGELSLTGPVSGHSKPARGAK